MVRPFDDVQVMLDDDDSVARLHQPVDDLYQFMHIIHMQACGRLVHNIDSLARAGLGQFQRQLHPLRLTAGKRRCALAHLDVAQAYVHKRLDLTVDLGDVFEKGAGLLHCHVQNIGDGLPLILYLKRFAVVARALAHLAGHIDVRQKVHGDLDNAVALAGLAAAALDIEAEAARPVAAHLRLLRL